MSDEIEETPAGSRNEPAGGGSAEERSGSAEAGLEEQLESVRKEAASNYDRYLRAEAELQNVIKRHDRDRGERVKYAAESLGRDLLDVVDDLERALQHADASAEAGASLTDGVKMVRERLLAVLERHGIERIDARGKPFDPAEHEAVTMVETDQHESNVVVDEHRAGYRIHDRLLRPAMVAVSKPGAGGQESKDN